MSPMAKDYRDKISASVCADHDQSRKDIRGIAKHMFNEGYEFARSELSIPIEPGELTSEELKELEEMEREG